MRPDFLKQIITCFLQHICTTRMSCVGPLRAFLLDITMLIFNTIKQEGCSPNLDESFVIKISGSYLALNNQKYYSNLCCKFYTKSPRT